MAKTSAIVEDISAALVADLSMVQSETQDIERSTTAGTGATATRFWIDIQSADSEKVRQKTHIRMAHAVTVSILMSIKPKQQFTSYKSSLDVEGKVIDTLMDQTTLASQRTLWLSTDREFVNNGKHVRLDIIFDIEDNYTIGSSL